MSTEAVSYETTYSPELIALAARAFRDYQFRRYGRLLLACCIVNALGLGLALWFGSKLSDLYLVVLIVAIGPIWLAYKYFLAPHTMAAKLCHVLAPAGRVTVSSSAVVLPARNGKSFELPWSMVRDVQEMEDFFLLVLSPLSAYLIPKLAMPTPALGALHARSRSNAA